MKIIGNSVGFLFGAVWVLGWTAGAGTFDYMMISGAVGQIRATGFPSTDGRMLKSRVESSDDTTSLDIEYEFHVDGRRFTSTKYRFDDMGSDDGYADEVAARLPEGSKVTVYYNPSNPSDAVLETGINGSTLFMALFMMPFNVIMAVSWWATISMLRGAGSDESKEPVPPTVVQTDFLEIVYMPGIAPLGIALGSLFGLAFISIFIIGFSFGFHAPLSVMIGWWIGLLVIAGGLGFRSHMRRAKGITGIVIDIRDNTITIPKYERRRRETMPIHEIRDVTLERKLERHSEGESTYKYVPTLVVNDNTDEGGLRPIAACNEQPEAAGVVEWLQERIR